ncbi:hypothetical protein AALP_AA7G198000 [Arabis alpina]|uniref:TF-B3 domain-containing protein n=1 Tax=Arabis alpina TaxID=50452 RepID=A0A087GJ88_ARAAL|nr:hypothetical protein AALP_AA7G198000 [Arabis alpina]
MKWEEELYWTHFQTLHFSQLLLPGFHNRLVIPQKFSTHCKRKLPKIVTLKSPSGVTYNVGLEEHEDKTLAFCSGWDKFVKDHSLVEHDLLVFKFHGLSEFEVLIFDGDTFCEKPTCYFVKKCGHAEKKTIKGIDFTATSSRSLKRDITTDDVETTQPVITPDGNELEDLIDTDTDTDTDTMLTPNVVVSSQTGYEQEEHINSDIDTASGQIPVVSPSSTRRISEGKYPLSVFKKMRGEISSINLDRKVGGRRKSISETSKRKALSLAKRAISPNGLLVVMKRSHVLSKFFLTIPMKWSWKNKLLEPQEVVMQVDQTKWQLMFKFYGARGYGGISTGWRKFAQDNNLCMGDVCVFEPAKSGTKPHHLDVYIFRAAEAESSNNG